MQGIPKVRAVVDLPTQAQAVFPTPAFSGTIIQSINNQFLEVYPLTSPNGILVSNDGIILAKGA